MSETANLRQRWKKFRPSKSLWFWSMIAASVITMFVGFRFAGWVTDGRATWMATHAQAKLVASFCVQQFTSNENAVKNLGALQNMTTGARHNYIKEGGWAMVHGIDTRIPGAASLCAKELAQLDRHAIKLLKTAPAGI